MLAIKEFEVEEGSVEGGRYKIVVKSRGKVVDTFAGDTMLGCQNAFRQAGYKLVAWTEGRRIVLRDES